MKARTFSRAIKAAAVTLLLPCVAFAAPPRNSQEGDRGTIARGTQVGSPVTPHSINVDLRTLPKAKPWQQGMLGCLISSLVLAFKTKSKYKYFITNF